MWNDHALCHLTQVSGVKPEMRIVRGYWFARQLSVAFCGTCMYVCRKEHRGQYEVSVIFSTCKYIKDFAKEVGGIAKSCIYTL